MEVSHSEACATAALLKKCNECRKIHYRITKRNARAKKKANIIETRFVTIKKRSIYHDILCNACQFKKVNEFCDICIPKYNCAKTAKAKKQKTSNQSNSTEVIKLGGDSIRNGGSDDRNDTDDSLDIHNVKKASI